MTKGWGLKHEQELGEPESGWREVLENEGGRYSRQGSRHKCPVMGQRPCGQERPCDGHTELSLTQPISLQRPMRSRGPHRPGKEQKEQFLQEGQEMRGGGVTVGATPSEPPHMHKSKTRLLAVEHLATFPE